MRLIVFAGMCCAAWLFATSGLAIDIFTWAKSQNHPSPEGFAAYAVIVVSIIGLIGGVIFAFLLAYDNKWKATDMLQRAPFMLWCGITDDCQTIHLGTALLWPLVAIVDLVVSLLLVIVIMTIGVVELLSLKLRV